MNPPADIIVLNGHIFGAVDPRQTAVVVSHGRIVALATPELAAAWRGARTQVIDAAGGLVMPGFNDAHMHLRHGALALEQLNLFGLTELDEIKEAIRAYAAARPDARWISGGGWFYAAFSGGLPNRDLLDELVPDRPAYLGCFDGHSGWANSRALELAGINETTPDPPNGEIVRDAGGRPTGALKERACEIVSNLVPQPDDEQTLALLGRALHALARSGITAAQDAWATPADFALLDRLRARQPLPLRLRVALELLPGQTEAGLEATLDEFESASAGRESDPFLRGGIIKSFLDGVVEARTAYMLEPYPGTDTRGDARWLPGELHGTLARLHRRGWQVELHAIGTAAVRQALDAYQSLGPGEAAARRHRIEHIETIDPADLERFARLGVVASMQPFHAIPESEQADTWRNALDPGIADSGWRIGSLLSSGAVLAFGSDWPVVPFDPFLELHAAVNRQSAKGLPAGGWLPTERVSIGDALRAFTWGSAYAEHAEDRRGLLAEGYEADLVVLDRDLLAEDASSILGTSVVATIVGGRLVHVAA